MFRINQLLAVLFVVIAGTSFGQTKSNAQPKKKDAATGFYGKRFVMQFGGGLHHNTFLKLASDHERNYREYYYNYMNGSQKADQFNYSLYGNVGAVLKDNLVLSLDFNYYFGNMFIENYGYKEHYNESSGMMEYTYGKTARIDYRTIRIMPRVEISSHGSNAPTGLTNIIGLGVELSKGKSGSYDAFINDNYYYGSTTSGHYAPNTSIKLPDRFATNIVLMYGLEYRIPISKNLAWNFGGYAHLNLPVQVWLEDADIFGSISMYNDDWRFTKQLSVYRVQNLFSLRTGIMIML